MQYPVKIAITACAVCLGGVCLHFTVNETGVPAQLLEADARVSQGIPEDWLMEQAVSEEMAAMIFFPEDQSNYVVSIYVKQPWPSTGYFFRYGGAVPGMDKYLSGITFEKCKESAVVTTNGCGVERLEIDNGNSQEIVNIDSRSPFALILPKDADEITFYDTEGSTVEYWSWEG